MLRRCRPLLGTFVEISAECESAIELAFAAVARVHRLMSAHDRDSDLSRINRLAHLQPIEVDDWTALVIGRAVMWARSSDGAFDPVRAGKAAVERGAIPRHAGQPLTQAGDWTALELDGRCVELREPGCIDLGGIAKGFAVDAAADALRAAGSTLGLVNAGGDVRAVGSSTVTIVDPLSRRPAAEVAIEDQALATSAGLAMADGSLSFDHLGGRTGPWTSVSVVARSACDADALTKIVWSRWPGLAPLLAEAGARGLAIGADGTVADVGDAVALAA